MLKVSVVIPVYNRMHLIERALDSVINQTCPADEIIVVDDGSTDDTAGLVRQNYPQVTVVSRENRGVSSARNTGIKHAGSDWIAFLDSDDEWYQEKLEKQCHAIMSTPGYLLCHTNEQWIRNDKPVNQMKKHRKYGGKIFRYCLPLCVISPSSVLIHQSVFENIGLFDETLPACEDYELWLRICARYPVLYLDEPLINKYGGHNGQLSRKFWGMDRFRILALEKIISDPNLRESDRNAAINTMLDKINIYLIGARKRGTLSHVDHFENLAMKYS